MTDSCCKKHFVLVHGAKHGARCWVKLEPLLENAGHRVTALDMAASGINLKRIDELRTLRDYSEPLIQLMASLVDDEKVIVVGHSLGGLNLALVMEMFPHKIDVAVFLTAFMPDTRNTPSHIYDQFAASKLQEEDFWLDTEFKSTYGDSKEPLETILFGPQFFSKLYSLSSSEDMALANTMKRPSSVFLDDLRKPESKLSEERYGSVQRVYVVADKDEIISPSFQRWMIQNGGVKEVMELKGSDHMPMFSMPNQLCDSLLEIAQNDY